MNPLSDEKITFEVPRRYVDERLDRALLLLCKEKESTPPSFSRVRASRLINEGKVRVNGKKVKPTYVVALRDTIEIDSQVLFSEENPVLSPNAEMKVEILFENDDLLVVNKPPGLQIHPAGAHTTDTLVNWLIACYPKIQNVGESKERPGIVHRIDRETSGVLVIAKHQATFLLLKQAFQERKVEKKYLALVHGHLKKKEGIIDASLFRPSGALKRQTVQTKASGAKSRALPGNTREAVTHYRVVMRYQDFDLVEVVPKTGRTHQIRAHFSSVGHPLAGDRLYTFKAFRPFTLKKQKNAFFSPRQMLHAHSLSFELFSEKYRFTAPLPTDFRQRLLHIDETKRPGYDDEALKSLLRG